MLFDTIGTKPKLTKEAAVEKYWGGKVNSEPHPKYRYGCDAHPTGWAQISEEDFAESMFFRYSPIATGWTRTVLGDARLFFMHNDTGFALIGDYHPKKLSIFKFGCEHKFKGVEVGRCLTRYTCEKCGFVETIDSSD